MTKLEQLSELLVSEISQFEKTVEKLEKIQKEKIGIDSRDLELLFQQHYEKMEKVLDKNTSEMQDLGAHLKKSKAYPVWALTTFCASLIINGILIYLLISNL